MALIRRKRYFPLLLLLVATVGFASPPDEDTKGADSPTSANPTMTIGDEANAVVEQDAAQEAKFRTPPGYKKKKRGDKIMYCRSETPIGTRFAQEYCFTQNQLERIEKSKQGMQDDLAMRQRMCTTQTACGEY